MMFAIHNFFLHFAANPSCDLTPGVGGQIFGFPTWYHYLNGELVAGKCTPIFDLRYDLGRVILAVIEILLRIAALAAIGFVIYGGYRFILSQGEPEQANAARSTIINALIGLVITVMATVIVTFVFNSLAKY